MKHLLYVAVTCLLCLSAMAEPMVLWPDGAPGAIGNEDADIPMLTVNLAPKDSNTGAAVVVCPGGGYGALAMDHEGKQVAEWFNRNGINAIILKYRIAPRYHHPAPMQDVQRALRTVRYNAKDWGIDPGRIGVMGFSAGGHLASTAGTHYDAGDPTAKDPIEQVSCRPDFMILVYPVITLDDPYAHKGSRRNLIGENPSKELQDSLSNEKQVTDDTPPTFLMHTYDDTGVPCENSIFFYLALRQHHVPAEMHLYEPGKHGFGLAPNDPVLSTWPDRCIDWLKTRGIISSK
ncbi:MAG: alpha/beta hydrolase fold domain-containing protein [bacterium]|nr:alpha/beta hydrolase fold domain-containing protein [bacterium]